MTFLLAGDSSTGKAVVKAATRGRREVERRREGILPATGGLAAGVTADTMYRGR